MHPAATAEPPDSSALNTPDTPVPRTPAPALALPASPPAPAPLAIYNVGGNAHPFYHSRLDLPMPVLVAFGGGPLHRYFTGRPALDTETAVAEAPAGTLLRSSRFADPERTRDEWETLTFRLGPLAFIQVEDTRVIAYADTMAGARRLAEDFAGKYDKTPPPPVASFLLINTGRRLINTEVVPLEAAALLVPERFALHYGEEGATWHRDFTARLRTARRGLAILEGPPGTGKTSYLRHLMGELNDTHRFYFVPPVCLGVLSDPDFIDFWAKESRRHEGRQLAVILEDADAALTRRGADNRSQVSAILNLSDGMMGDFLRLHILCTVNCRADDLDPALLRPGRLLCHRRFERMEGARARQLAAHLGRDLPEGADFSLAEVYAGADQMDVAPERPRLGFAA